MLELVVFVCAMHRIYANNAQLKITEALAHAHTKYLC